MEVEMAHNLHRDYERGRDQLSAQLRQLIERGREYKAIDYTRAVAGIGPLNEALAAVFDEFDAILTPAAPGEAPRGLASTGNPVFCTTWTYLGVPAVTLPLLQLGGRAAYRRAARRPSRQRCAPLAQRALACQNARTRSSAAPRRQKSTATAKAERAAPQEGQSAMMMILITGLIGIALLATFLGIMVWWVKALPLIIIVVGVLALLIYDFVQELRDASKGAAR